MSTANLSNNSDSVYRFTHTGNRIILNEIVIPYSFFITLESDYVLPEGVRGIDYNYPSFIRYFNEDGSTEAVDNYIWKEGLTYIGRRYVYESLFRQSKQVNNRSNVDASISSASYFFTLSLSERSSLLKKDPSFLTASQFKTYLRIKRDYLLKDSDWTQLVDSPLSDETKKEWASYRSKLRDLFLNLSDDEILSLTLPSSP